MFVHEPWHESKISTHIEQTSKVTETSKHQDRKFIRNDLVMYTNRSMVESKLSAAVICRNNDQYEQVRLSMKSKVVDTETVAIRKALKYAYNYCKGYRQIKQVIVFSNSQSSIRKLERTDAFSS